MAQGQNLISNSTFDTDVSGWYALSGSTLAWDALDANDDPLSGSALVTNVDLDPNDGNGTVQCIDGLVGETYYAFSADAYIPGGQTESGLAYLLIQWYSGAGCSGQIGIAESSSLPSSAPDSWAPCAGFGVTPTGTQSARLRLSVMKYEAGGSLDAQFDNAWFEPAVFIDGFESGDLSAWPSSFP